MEHKELLMNKGMLFVIGFNAYSLALSCLRVVFHLVADFSQHMWSSSFWLSFHPVLINCHSGNNFLSKDFRVTILRLRLILCNRFSYRKSAIGPGTILQRGYAVMSVECRHCHCWCCHWHRCGNCCLWAVLTTVLIMETSYLNIYAHVPKYMHLEY